MANVMTTDETLDLLDALHYFVAETNRHPIALKAYDAFDAGDEDAAVGYVDRLPSRLRARFWDYAGEAVPSVFGA